MNWEKSPRTLKTKQKKMNEEWGWGMFASTIEVLGLIPSAGGGGRETTPQTWAKPRAKPEVRDLRMYWLRNWVARAPAKSRCETVPSSGMGTHSPQVTDSHLTSPLLAFQAPLSA